MWRLGWAAWQAHTGAASWWRCPRRAVDGDDDDQGALALGLDVSTRAMGYCVLDARGTWPVLEPLYVPDYARPPCSCLCRVACCC